MKIKISDPEFSALVAPVVCGFAAYRATALTGAEFVNKDEAAPGWRTLAWVTVPEKEIVPFSDLKHLAEAWAEHLAKATSEGHSVRSTYPALEFEDGRYLKIRCHFTFSTNFN